MTTLDLRPFANRGFRDGVAGDGRGGWTDQGENSLEGEEWGRQVYRGVPFEIIRPDMNGDNGVIVLGSRNMGNLPDRVEGIPVGDGGAEKVAKLFFLHDTAWSENGALAFSYVLRHPDGSKTEIPIRVGKEVSDWWVSTVQGNRGRDLNPHTKLAWKNFRGHGLWAYEWVNPDPDKPVASIDIVSANKHPVPIVVAITAEMK